eukprot:gb/GECH01006682.1/.p1 GENE.gb/GECH01006682.1/~~gb/GECH01006682.1/.p1  ORF type:complete len:899 (+),score=228.29 gb/GECH01006682.1/:1-2697(+)
MSGPLSDSEPVQISLRIRPPRSISSKYKSKRIPTTIKPETDNETVVNLEHPNSESERVFQFDQVLDPNCSQEKFYETTCKKLINRVFQGINCCLLAYGQTGSGKTHTIFGERGNTRGENRGAIPRAIEHIFQFSEKQKRSKRFSIFVSFIEVYLDQIGDLGYEYLKKIQKHIPQNKPNSGSSNYPYKSLDIRENPDGTMYIKDLSIIDVSSQKEVMELIDIAVSKRRTFETENNEYSSRSHTVFTITVVQKDERDPSNTVTGRLNLVDLAGSERLKNSESTLRFKEGVFINKSLSTLGNVILGIDRGDHHIPYRDSKLTRILKDSLGGNSETILLCAVNPSPENYEESLATLQFANRCKNVKNNPVVNYVDFNIVEHQERKIKQLESEIELLKGELKKCREEGLMKDERIQKLSNALRKSSGVDEDIDDYTTGEEDEDDEEEPFQTSLMESHDESPFLQSQSHSKKDNEGQFKSQRRVSLLDNPSSNMNQQIGSRENENLTRNTSFNYQTSSTKSNNQNFREQEIQNSYLKMQVERLQTNNEKLKRKLKVERSKLNKELESTRDKLQKTKQEAEETKTDSEEKLQHLTEEYESNIRTLKENSNNILNEYNEIFRSISEQLHGESELKHQLKEQENKIMEETEQKYQKEYYKKFNDLEHEKQENKHFYKKKIKEKENELSRTTEALNQCRNESYERIRKLEQNILSFSEYCEKLDQVMVLLKNSESPARLKWFLDKLRIESTSFETLSDLDKRIKGANQFLKEADAIRRKNSISQSERPSSSASQNLRRKSCSNVRKEHFPVQRPRSSVGSFRKSKTGEVPVSLDYLGMDRFQHPPPTDSTPEEHSATSPPSKEIQEARHYKNQFQKAQQQLKSLRIAHESAKREIDNLKKKKRNQVKQ